MRLSELLTPDRIRIPLRAQDKGNALRELVSLLSDHASGDLQAGILQSILEREQRMSTGIGQGVAIPHGKTELVDRMEMAFGIATRPIEYEALDGEPVALFFLLVSPPDLTGPHIKVLAQISRMLSSDGFRDGLARVANADEVLALLRREEPAAEA